MASALYKTDTTGNGTECNELEAADASSSQPQPPTIKQESPSQSFGGDHSSHANLTDEAGTTPSSTAIGDDWILVSHDQIPMDGADKVGEKREAAEYPPLWPVQTYPNASNNPFKKQRKNTRFNRSFKGAHKTIEHGRSSINKQNVVSKSRPASNGLLYGMFVRARSDLECSNVGSAGMATNNPPHNDSSRRSDETVSPYKEVEGSGPSGVFGDAARPHDVATRPASHLPQHASGNATVKKEESVFYMSTNARPYFKETIDIMVDVDTVLDTETLDEFFDSLVRDGVITAEEAHRRTGRQVCHKLA